MTDEVRNRVIACEDVEQLRALAIALAGAADLRAAEDLLAGLPAAKPEGARVG